MYSPTTGRVSSEYGYRSALSSKIKSMLHAGIDIAAKTGTPIYAAFGGTVVKAGSNVVSGRSGLGTLIKNTDGAYQYYGHQSRILVSVGDVVTEGQKIGLVGATGNVTGSHLHFETWSNSNSVTGTFNPRILFKRYGLTPGVAGSSSSSTTVSSDTIKIYQKQLKATKHYSGEVDGVSGTMTVTAVKLFQTDYKLTVDGVWGSESGTKMTVVINLQSPTLTVDGNEGILTVAAEEWALTAAGVYSGRIDGNRGTTVLKAEQSLLSKGGFYTGDIDGIFGTLSVKAEQTYLKQLGYYTGVVDGDRGSLTIKALQTCLNAKKFKVVTMTKSSSTSASSSSSSSTSSSSSSSSSTSTVTTPVSFVKIPDGKVYKVHHYAGTYWHVPNQTAYKAIKEILTEANIAYGSEKAIAEEDLPNYGVEIA